MAGIEQIPLRIPPEWNAAWFETFVREVLSKADVRNAVGNGIIITGTSDVVATLKTDLNGETGVLSIDITDNVITISIETNGINFDKIQQIATSTLLGRATAGTGDIEDLSGTDATALLDAFTGDGGSGGIKGLVPAPGTGDAGKYLDGGGLWTALPEAAAVADLNQTISGTYTQSEVQAISDKVDELLANLRTAGLLAV